MKLKFTIAISLVCTLLGQSIKLNAQTIVAFVDSILNNRTIKISTYKQQFNSFESKVFAMEFCKSNFIDTSGLYMLQNAEILAVNLVFTDYPSSLDLKPLNRSRFIQLNKFLPKAMFNKNTRWQVIRQMDGYDKNSAQNMLHGFVINYRLPITEKEWKREMDYIRAVTPDPVVEPEYEVENIPQKKEKVNHWDAIHSSQNTYSVLFDRFIKKISNDKLKIDDEFRKRDSIVTFSTKDALKYRIISGKERDLDLKKDSLFVLLDELPKKEEYLPLRPKPKIVLKKDSTFFKVVERNKFKNLLVVADVTTSMSPYNAQVIQWISHLTDEHNLKALVCFNDGDSKQTEQKIIGNTGGIYGEIYKTPTQMGELVENTMSKGSGGDLPENDCEAIIKAINMFSDYGDIALIADAWAPVRDIELVNQIKKPINVIVCGNELGPHPDLVAIAYFTKGSLSFNDVDFTDFSALSDNKVLTIKGTCYILKNGRVAYATK
jgi:hypothetical protein